MSVRELRVAVTAPDYDEALAFYRDVLGLPEREAFVSEDVGSGLAPVSPGWFVVNVADAAWVRNDAFGGRCVFENTPRVLAERPDVEPQYFTQTGFTLAVLEPGKPSGMYHAESVQEDFLVLAGTCRLTIEEQERELRAWDFVHCPPDTWATLPWRVV